MEARTNFTSVSRAFSALSPELRAHCKRVEQYAELIFMEIIAEDVYTENVRSRVRLKPELRPALRQAALYHDIGKALVPDFYQWDSPDYSPEEQALYRKHSADGRRLLEELLPKEGITPDQANMILESVTYHHERWDGEGTPEGLAEEKIPIVGRIVAVADALDHLLMSTRTETPVDTAMDALMDESGAMYDPVIMGIMYEAKRKIAKIFALYAQDSKAIPQPTRIIRRKAAKRPVSLRYRPIAELSGGQTAAVEADMVFHVARKYVP